MTKAEVIELATLRLGQVGHGIVFDVVKSGVRRTNTWWHVPVVATRNGKDVPREVTVKVYANIEDDLEQERQLSVLFVPVKFNMLNKNVLDLLKQLEQDIADFYALQSINPQLAEELACWIIEDRKHRRSKRKKAK
jgi:hypothetical protein